MYQQSFSTGGESTLRLHVRRAGGDLRLIGTDETYLRLQGDGDEGDFEPQYQNGDLTLDVREDCTLFVPYALAVTIDGVIGDLKAVELAAKLSADRINGDVTLNAMTGQVQLGAVSGDLRVAGAGNVNTGLVRGDVSATDIAQLLQIGGVMGDVSVRSVHSVQLGNVQGDLRAVTVVDGFAAGSVNGDVNLAAIGGRVTLGTISGDARLADVGAIAHVQAGGDLYVDTRLDGESACQFTAGGDATLTVPGDSQAQITCQAGGDIVNEFGGGRSRAGSSATFTLGEGGATVRVQAGGDIRIKPREGEAMEFRFEIHKEEMQRAKDELKRAKEDMRRVQREIRDQMRATKHEIRRTVREDVQGAVRHAVTFRVPGFAFGGGPHGGAQKPMRETTPVKTGASEDERLEILKMLEQKAITTEQAELLLAALGDE
ncbi:MAG: hypothetical protein HZB53_00800 [Chloroflexi bacterium]|nr:hypothetical protein [Chloroflexota bacterium]